MEKLRSKWVILVISCMLMMCFALTLQALPPLFELMKKDISFTNSQAGMLMGVYAIPGIFLPFFIPVILKRFSIEKLIIFALAIMVLGQIAFSLANTFGLLLLFRLFVGTGSTMVVVLAPLLVTMSFDKDNMGKAMGIFNTAVPLGSVIAANAFSFLGLMMGWRWIMVFIALYVAFVFVLIMINISPSVNSVKETDEGNRTKSSKRSVYLLGLIWTLANALMIAYMSFGAQYYQEKGMSQNFASFLTSMIMLLSIFLSPIMGILFDKTGKKRIFLIVGNGIIGISFLSILFIGKALPLWAVLIGVGYATIPVYVFSVLSEVMDPSEMGMGLSILTVASNLGVTLGPIIVGFLLDVFKGSFFVVFMTFTLYSVSVLVISLFVKEKDASSFL